MIEGNVGAGKSTLAKALHKRILNSKLFMEPVEENPYLQLFYKDPERWALEMQYFLFGARYKMHIEAIDYTWETFQTCIFDRSIYGDAVFEENLYLSGLITETGHRSYRSFADVVLKGRGQLVPHMMIYLSVSPEECMRRIKGERKRDCEKGISLDYLKGLNDGYFRLISRMKDLGTKVIELNWENYGDVDQVVEDLGLNESWQGWSRPKKKKDKNFDTLPGQKDLFDKKHDIPLNG